MTSGPSDPLSFTQTPSLLQGRQQPTGTVLKPGSTNQLIFPGAAHIMELTIGKSGFSSGTGTIGQAMHTKEPHTPKWARNGNGNSQH
jgi:hypothetical protein